jgi:hypothetical protein
MDKPQLTIVKDTILIDIAIVISDENNITENPDIGMPVDWSRSVKLY